MTKGIMTKNNAIEKIILVLTETDGDWIASVAEKVLAANCEAMENADGDDEITIYKHGSTEVKSADDVINDINACLLEADIEFVQKIFDIVCTQKVKIVS